MVVLGRSAPPAIQADAALRHGLIKTLGAQISISSTWIFL
jgi:hypothetical protein